jgi:asparagine synthase (glutamine-hydrolysing)
MNRIAGILHFDGMPVTQTELDRMLTAFGPHVRGQKRIWAQGGVGLACLGKAHQGRALASPPHAGLTITFDGRIDNRGELLASLVSEHLGGHIDVSDEEIVLAAYEKWGLDCPKHLIGDFAFAIWDGRKQRLLCVRDHFGVKPFYYYASISAFLFASTPESLLASGCIPPRVSEERIADFLVESLEGVDKSSSFYQDVFRLPPGHILVVQPEGIRLQRYWELCTADLREGGVEADHVAYFSSLFEESVRCRLEDTAVPASMLSGGMDSSSIIGVGRKILAETGREPLHAFAFRSNTMGADRDSTHILSVLAQGHVCSHLVSEMELSGCLDRLVGAVEAETEPFDCLMNLNRALYIHAAEQGANALLDGVDGDLLLSGSGHLIALWREGAYRTLVQETLHAEGLTAEYNTSRSELFNSFFSAIRPLVPDWILNVRQRYYDRKVVPHSVRQSIIAPDFADHAQLGQRFATLQSSNPTPTSFAQMELHKTRLNHTCLTVGLERYERVASAFGIEARHPFTDVRLAEFCLGLPWQLKTRRGWTKYILRRAMEPYLPAEVVWRRDKDSLMWKVNRLILKERAEYFYQVTCDEQANLKPYVNLGKLMSFWYEYLTHGDENRAEWIWSGIALALWLRRQRKLQTSLRES